MDSSALSTPPAPRSKKRRNIIIAMIALAMGIAVGLGFFLLAKSSDDKKPSTKVYVETKGYDYSEGVGDAVALFFKPGASEPFSFMGTKVMQACNLLSISDVRELGLKTMAHPQGDMFQRVYFDSEGRGKLMPAQYDLPDAEDSNSCRYAIEGGVNLTVDMFQPPYATTDSLSNQVAKWFKQIEPIGELNVYEWNIDQISIFIIGRGDTGVQVSVSSAIPVEQRTKLLEKLAANFIRERANPKGAPEVFIESPLIKTVYADSCKLLSAESVNQVFSTEASPLVVQSYGMSVGVRRVKEDVLANYVSNQCERWAEPKETGNLENRYVQLRANTYTTIEAAQGGIDFTAPNTKERQAIDDLGDQALYVSDPLGERLVVREAAFVLEFSFRDGHQVAGKAKTLELLKPVAREALKQLPR